MHSSGLQIDFRGITERQKSTWATGDFNEIARQMMSVSETLCEAADPRAGQRVLDVACGSGNAALVAARRYCDVVGIDYVPSLVERARQRAAADGVPADFRVADAQALPFDDASFDVVVSVFGVIFAPDQRAAADELLRVCRPGGTIALANWGPGSFGADLFEIHTSHISPQPGLRSVTRWGTEEGLSELLGRGIASSSTRHRHFRMYFLSLDHAVNVFATNFGPTQLALEVLQEPERRRLREDLRRIFQRYDTSTDETLVLDCEYLEVVATRGV